MPIRGQLRLIFESFVRIRSKQCSDPTSSTGWLHLTFRTGPGVGQAAIVARGASERASITEAIQCILESDPMQRGHFYTIMWAGDRCSPGRR